MVTRFIREPSLFLNGSIHRILPEKDTPTLYIGFVTNLYWRCISLRQFSSTSHTHLEKSIYLPGNLRILGCENSPARDVIYAMLEN